MIARKRRLPAALIAAALTAAAALAAAAGPAAAAPRPPAPHTHLFQRHPGQIRQAPSTAIPGAGLPGHLVRHAATATSDNWSGYADQACATCKFRYAQADFSIPSLNCAGVTTTRQYQVSDWVGLDGWTDSTIEQAGVDGFCEHATPVYFAWYEMFPLARVVFRLAASPGDNVFVSVYFNSATGHWQLGLTDTTLGAGFATSQLCPAGSSCRNSSAEVITEEPGLVVTAGSLLARFGQVNYNNATVTSRNGTHGNLGSTPLWTSFAVTMQNPGNGHVMAAPSVLVNGTSAGGIPVSAFEDTWKASS